MAARDELYAEGEWGEIPPFCFDSKVAEVFDDMIRRSVPGYGWTLEMLEVIARKHAAPEGIIYDLGCSLGAGMFHLARGSREGQPKVVGVDSSPAMLERTEGNLQKSLKEDFKRCELLEGDLRAVPLQSASVIAMNFTLQFIEKQDRLELLEKCRQALLPNGVFVLSEKVHSEDAKEEVCLQTLHEGFKEQQGYSKLEIARKRASLEEVLRPETEAEHHRRLKDAGFSQSITWMRCFNFISIIAS